MLETNGNRVLLDCGLFQGRREETERRNRYLGFDPKEIDTVLLSHAHIDHSGALPALARYGFSGKVFATKATADLSEVMLADSAHIQESDCLYVNRKERRTEEACRQPFYTSDDVQTIKRQFVGLRYSDVVTPLPGMKATFHDAGHILGSAAISLRIMEAGSTKTILFSGDLGRRQMPILRDPQPPPSCDILIIESTYGDRLHSETAEEAKQKASALIHHAIVNRSKIIVPAFAVGRTQDLVIWIKVVSRRFPSISIRPWRCARQKSSAGIPNATMKTLIGFSPLREILSSPSIFATYHPFRKAKS